MHGRVYQCLKEPCRLLPPPRLPLPFLNCPLWLVELYLGNLVLRLGTMRLEQEAEMYSRGLMGWSWKRAFLPSQAYTALRTSAGLPQPFLCSPKAGHGTPESL